MTTRRQDFMTTIMKTMTKTAALVALLVVTILAVAQLRAWDGCNEPAWWAVRGLSGLWEVVP